MILVLVAIAMASVLGFALLSSSAMQSQASHNHTQSATNQYVAESAIQAALYYLQYPQFMPPDWGTTPGYYIHATKQELGEPFKGTFDLTVKQTSQRNFYEVRAIALPTPDAVPREMTAIVSVDRATVTKAGVFGGAVTIPLRVNMNGPVQANGSFNNQSATAVASISLAPLAPTAYQSPTTGTINYYGADLIDGKYVCPDGTVGYAQQLLAAPNATPAVAANNPGKIFFYKNELSPDLVLSAPVTINGTLIVKGGGLSVRSAGVVINPDTGFPGLIVDKDLNMYRQSVNINIGGLTWVGRHITWTGPVYTGSHLTINGALLMPAGSQINGPGNGAVAHINYVSAKADVPDLTRTPQPGNSVKLVSWNE